MTQDEMKAAAARAALEYVREGAVIGVGSGSTTNHFIDQLAGSGLCVAGAVASSEATAERLRGHGIAVLDPNAAGELDLYVDGADEVDGGGFLIKGGGGALTREKIVASQARRFVCIVDESKCVAELGGFPLPVEVIPMATAGLSRRFAALGGRASVRMASGRPFVTDNGQHVLDVSGLRIADPRSMEMQLSQWPGVVTVGVFALQKAQLCLVGTPQGVRRLEYQSAPAPRADP